MDKYESKIKTLIKAKFKKLKILRKAQILPEIAHLKKLLRVPQIIFLTTRKFKISDIKIFES